MSRNTAGNDDTRPKSANVKVYIKAVGQEREIAKSMRSRIIRQLKIAKSAIKWYAEDLQMIRKTETSRAALSSHLGGFYEEIEKQTKGNGQMPVTTFVVEMLNEIVGDAKTIARGDTYLDRVNEFAPAGAVRCYSDILLTSRIVRESLERLRARLEERSRRSTQMLREAQTITAAAQEYLDYRRFVTKKEVEGLLGSQIVSDRWFISDEDGDAPEFDMDELDRIDLDEYFSDDAESAA